MTTAIYIEDGVVQFVLTPETAFEKRFVEDFEEHTQSGSLKITHADFYACVGGFITRGGGTRSLVLCAKRDRGAELPPVDQSVP